MFGVALAALFGALFSIAAPHPTYANQVPPPGCTFDNDPTNNFAYLQTFEALEWKTTYARTIELAGFNQLLPNLGAYNFNLGTMDNAATPYLPPTLLKAIAWLESNWTQGSWGPPSGSVPYDKLVDYGQVGPALVSPDCGYGIMQVTTGMQNTSGVPALDQAMIAGNYAFDIARGARILADKWNLAPEYRPVAGTRNVKLLGDYYYAVWGYNGFAYVNHPLNPSFNSLRPPFSCDARVDSNGNFLDHLGHDRSQYPYQELVYGCLAHPPVLNGTALWTAIDVQLPNLNDPAFSGPLSLSNWTPCTVNFQCAPMNIPSPDPTHQDPTTVSLTTAQVMGSPALGLSQTQVGITVVSGSTATSAPVTISNTGTGVLTWLATPSASWLLPSAWQGVAVPGQPGTFKAIVDASGLAPGTYTQTIAFGSLYPQGTLGTLSVQVTVNPGPSPTPSPSPSPTPSPTPTPPPAVPGDADCDAQVTVLDAVGMLVYIAKLGIPACAAVSDWNCDGQITIADAVGVLLFVSGESPVSNCAVTAQGASPTRAAPLTPTASATPTPTSSGTPITRR